MTRRVVTSASSDTVLPATDVLGPDGPPLVCVLRGGAPRINDPWCLGSIPTRIIYGSTRSFMEARFWSKVNKTEGCWLWTAFRNPKGYGRFYVSELRPSEYAHRYSYEIHRGPIPEGMEIDHLCKNTSCIRPDHLEVVTGRVNNSRSNSTSANHAKKTTCPKGHSYSHVSVGKFTCRRCRVCNTEQAKLRRRKL
jgi:hypothetical protein